MHITCTFIVLLLCLYWIWSDKVIQKSPHFILHLFPHLHCCHFNQYQIDFWGLLSYAFSYRQVIKWKKILSLIVKSISGYFLMCISSGAKCGLKEWGIIPWKTDHVGQSYASSANTNAMYFCIAPRYIICHLLPPGQSLLSCQQFIKHCNYWSQTILVSISASSAWHPFVSFLSLLLDESLMHKKSIVTLRLISDWFWQVCPEAN